MQLSIRMWCAVVGLLAAVGNGSDEPSGWPCWRGADGTGVSSEHDWLSEGKADPLWERDVGRGHSCVVVVENRLYTLGFDEENGQDVVWCLDALSGEEIWTFFYPAQLLAVGHGGGTLTTPAVEDERVFLTNREGVVRCLDAGSGELVWERDMRSEHGVESTGYGFGGSPLVLEEMLVVNANRTIALDKDTGDTIWTTRAHMALYSTPCAVVVGETPSLAIFGKEGLSILARATGEERHAFPWRHGSTTVNASTPVVAGAERLFVSSAYDHGAALVDFASGAAKSVWETKAMRTKLSGCVLVDGHLYGFDESMLKCLGLDGKERWRKRGLGMGALMAAGQRLIVQSAKGELVIVGATPERYTELSRQSVVPRATSWASPVLAGGRIYCRNGNGDLVCRDHRP